MNPSSEKKLSYGEENRQRLERIRKASRSRRTPLWLSFFSWGVVLFALVGIIGGFWFALRQILNIIF